MSSKDRIRDWFFGLPQETREQIDQQIENIRNQEDVTEKHQQTLTKMVKELARMLEPFVDDPSQISVIIKAIANGRISDDVIQRALPEDKKRKHKPYERYQQPEIRHADFSPPVTVASDGSESYTKPDRSEGEREGEPIDEEGTPFELYEGEPETPELDPEALKKLHMTEDKIIERIEMSVAREKELQIRLDEALKLADDKDKRIYELEMQAGELEIRLAETQKKQTPPPKDVDKIEDLTIERDNLKLALHEMQEIERARIKESGFTTASQLPKQVWVAAVNAMNFYVTLNKASKHATANNDPWHKIVFDVDKDGQLKAAKLESTGQGGGEFQV